LGFSPRLRVINYEQQFVECVLDRKQSCPAAVHFGGGAYCRMLWKFDATAPSS
jgi:hypothetical protein